VDAKNPQYPQYKDKIPPGESKHQDTFPGHEFQLRTKGAPPESIRIEKGGTVKCSVSKSGKKIVLTPEWGAVSASDYYGLLGVPRNADEATIKKAYKQKALEFHPDKCQLDKDVCQQKFIEVSTANEVLMDKDKRKTYDKHGEEGLKDGGAGQGDAEAMFRQFFGREPNGKVRIIRRGGMMQFVEEGEEGPEENLYDDDNVIELTSDTFNSFVNQRDEPWLVQFYKPNNDDCVEIKDEYMKVGSTFKDFVKIGAVNCRQQGDVCSGASIGKNDFPAVRWFPADPESPPEIFEGAINFKLLSKYVSSSLNDFSTQLNDKRQFREWKDNQNLPVVVLFSDKKEVPPMWKALSREFRNRVALGVVLRCDKNGVFKTELQREFDVRIPGVVQIDSLKDVGAIADKFSSSFKKESLSLWLMKVIAMSKKAGPVASFKEWSRERVQAGDCGPKDSQFCFLWLKAGADKQVEEAMRALALKYRTDPIKMMWVNVELNPSLIEAFGLESSEETDFFIAYRSKRGRFKAHEGELRFEALDTFVDGVINGGPLSGKVKSEKLEL